LDSNLQYFCDPWTMSRRTREQSVPPALEDDVARRSRPPTSRLRRGIRAARTPVRLSLHKREEPHTRVNSLRDVILGGQDGLVNILGIALGVVAANGSRGVLLTAGLAAAFTESISMGAVAYTSTLTERDHYLAEQAREADEIERMPEEERAELREIYARKGLRGELLEEVIDTICANNHTELQVMMDEELHLTPVEMHAVLRTSVIVTVACLIGHLLPLVPFVLLPRAPAVIGALALSACVLFGVGIYSAKTLVGDWWRSGLQMLVIGLGAAGIGFLVGRLFNTTGG
jgi:vacuolar iron transporter family protein